MNEMLQTIMERRSIRKSEVSQELYQMMLDRGL